MNTLVVIIFILVIALVVQSIIIIRYARLHRNGVVSTYIAQIEALHTQIERLKQKCDTLDCILHNRIKSERMLRDDED
jgi:cell division protein FtsL